MKNTTTKKQKPLPPAALLILGECTCHLAVHVQGSSGHLSGWGQPGRSWALGSGQVCREGPGSQEGVGEILSAEGWAGCWVGLGLPFLSTGLRILPMARHALTPCYLSASPPATLASLLCQKCQASTFSSLGSSVSCCLCPGSPSSSSSFARSVTHTHIVSASPSKPQVAFLDKHIENCSLPHPSFSILLFCLIYFFTVHHIFLTDVIV